MNKEKLSFYVGVITTLLNVINDLSFIIGAILFIVGSFFGAISKNGFYPSVTLFIIGSAVYTAGSVAGLISDALSVITKQKKANLVELIFYAGIFSFFVGSVLFTIGSAVYIGKTTRNKLTGDYLWDVGGGFFVAGGYLYLFVSKIKLTQLKRTKKHVFQSFRLWMSTLANDGYFLGSILFAIGAACFTVNTRPFDIAGNILWIIGSFCYIYGGLLKMVSDVLSSSKDFDSRILIGKKKVDTVVLRVSEP